MLLVVSRMPVICGRYVSEEGAFEFHYFFMRKFWMAYKCMGLVVCPGGSADQIC